MKTRKVAPATVTLGAMVAAAFATLLGGAPSANAACASFWGMGGGNGQCSSTFGNTAIAFGNTESASAVGGTGEHRHRVGCGRRGQRERWAVQHGHRTG